MSNDAIEMEANKSVAERRIVLVDMDLYKDAIASLKEQIHRLVEEKVISEQTAVKIFLEQEYSFFNKIVQIELHH